MIDTEKQIKAQQEIQMKNPPSSEAWQNASKEIHRLAKILTGKTFCPNCGSPIPEGQSCGCFDNGCE